jgi:hypothetical protein
MLSTISSRSAETTHTHRLSHSGYEAPHGQGARSAFARAWSSLAFMVAWHMAVGASGQGGLLLRVDPDQTDALIVDSRTSRFVIRGREIHGWLRINIDAPATDDELKEWIKHGVGYAKSLSPK